ncbi:MAG: hypothetical protein IMY67_10385, partial [Bacteroidetes bacterium]|nr:hypothetical protein [Bacteroidota bacterium]
MKITNKFKRKSLGEGRDFGLGFAFVEKEEKQIFKTKQAFTACKDYLNDVVFSEHSTVTLPSIYGFKHLPSNFMKDDNHFYLGVTTLDYNNG